LAFIERGKLRQLRIAQIDGCAVESGFPDIRRSANGFSPANPKVATSVSISLQFFIIETGENLL
jgi:hypothetical protein